MYTQLSQLAFQRDVSLKKTVVFAFFTKLTNLASSLGLRLTIKYGVVFA